MVQVFPCDDFLEKPLSDMRKNVNVLLLPHCDRTADHLNLSLPGVVVASITHQRLYNDFPTAVTSDPNFRTSTVVDRGFTLVT